jgi:hypothetical protein
MLRYCKYSELASLILFQNDGDLTGTHRAIPVLLQTTIVLLKYNTKAIAAFNSILSKLATTR